MASRWLVLLMLAALAGCVAEVPAAPPSDEPLAEAPVVLEPPVFAQPVSLGWNGRTAEPAIAVGPDGTVYVAAAPQLWRSDDGRAFKALGEPLCASGTPVCLPGRTVHVTTLDGFRGGDAAIGVDGAGAVYFLGLQGETGSVPFQVSRDRGESWSTPYDIAAGNASDRQWMKVMPDGTVLATWRDFGANGDGPDQLLFRRTLDGGATWEPTRVIGPDTLVQGPLATSPDGRIVYTPVYDGGLRILRSIDGGLSWTGHDIHPEERDIALREGRPIDLFPTIAVDDAGAVYVAWAADEGASPSGTKETTLPRVWLAVSLDEGATWSQPRALSSEGKVAAFPWIVAGKPGRVALTWYEGRAGTPSQSAPDVWDVALVESVTASAADPVFVGGYANAEPIHVGGMCRSGGGCEQVCQPPLAFCLGHDRSRAEVFEMALREGHPIVAWVADAQPLGTGIEVHVGGVQTGTPIG